MVWNFRDKHTNKKTTFMYATISAYSGGVLHVETTKGKQTLSCLKRKLDNVILDKPVMVMIHYPTGAYPEVITIYNTDISQAHAQQLSVKLISMAGED